MTTTHPSKKLKSAYDRFEARQGQTCLWRSKTVQQLNEAKTQLAVLCLHSMCAETGLTDWTHQLLRDKELCVRRM